MSSIRKDQNQNQKTEITKDNDTGFARGNKKGGCAMSAHLAEKYFCENTINEVIGLKELRKNITDVTAKALYKFDVITSGNVRAASAETIEIMSSKVLKTLLESYSFSPLVQFDEATNQWEVIINEIGVTGCGKIREEAIEVAIDNAIMLMENFFEEIELYIRLDETKHQFPYFLRIRKCSSGEELLEVLNLAE